MTIQGSTRVKRIADAVVWTMLVISILTIAYDAYVILDCGMSGILQLPSEKSQRVFRFFCTTPFWILSGCVFYLLPSWKILITTVPVALAICSLPVSIFAVIGYDDVDYSVRTKPTAIGSVTVHDKWERCGKHSKWTTVERNLLPGVAWSTRLKAGDENGFRTMKVNLSNEAGRAIDKPGVFSILAE